MARTSLRYTSTGVPLVAVLPAAVPPAAVPLSSVPLAPAPLSVMPDAAQVGPRAVPQWWRGPDPDLVLVRRLLVDERRTEREVAGLLGISRERLAAVLAGLGIERGQRARKRCPVDDAELRRLVEQGEGASNLARRFGVSWATAGRWLTDAGLQPADPGIDPVHLRELYVDQELTSREVAAALGVNKGRVLRALAAAGIGARSRSQRRPSGPRAAVTDDALRQLYTDPAMTVARAAGHFGVSESYLRGRATRLGLTKRPGTFTPHLPEQTLQDLTDRAPELYERGWTLTQIAAELGTSAQSVRLALHRAGMPVRAGGGARSDDRSGRVLIDELYADGQIVRVLREHHVRLPGSQGWRPAGPRQSYAPLPLPVGLLSALYVDVGLAMNEIAMLCGVGIGTVRSNLLANNITLRSNRQASPWKQRRHRQT